MNQLYESELIFMTRLPQPGGDQGNWGDILNDYLSQAHNSDGTLKDGSITALTITDGIITENKLDPGVRLKLNTGGGAQGSTGPQGPQGQPGATGPQGASGQMGPSGAQGPIGPGGAPGATGANGSTGPNGQTGATGPLGATGATGPMGPQGIAGSNGGVGPTGPRGQTGQDGTDATVTAANVQTVLQEIFVNNLVVYAGGWPARPDVPWPVTYTGPAAQKTTMTDMRVGDMWREA